jgi:SAM-dependent methyltransferase
VGDAGRSVDHGAASVDSSGASVDHGAASAGGGGSTGCGSLSETGGDASAAGAASTGDEGSTGCGSLSETGGVVDGGGSAGGAPAVPGGGAVAAPDGSPVDLYRLLPGDREAAIVSAAAGPGATVLELGCGAGRVTHPLVAFGHRVTAVDESPAMLACVTGAETVLADAADLDLGRRFDAVVLASHLVDTPVADLRRRLLATCARHVAPGGVVLVERHEPGWVMSAEPSVREAHGVVFDLHDVAHDGDRLRAVITYRFDGRSFDQPFEVVELGDDVLAADAAAAGLAVHRWLDDRRTWAVLVPAGNVRPGSIGES